MDLVKGILKNAMENMLFIISHLVMLCCAVLIFYNSAEAKTTEGKAKRKVFTVAKVAEPLVEKSKDKEFITDREMAPRLLQA